MSLARISDQEIAQTASSSKYGPKHVRVQLGAYGSAMSVAQLAGAPMACVAGYATPTSQIVALATT